MSNDKHKISSAVMGRCCVLMGCVIFFIFLCRFNNIDKVTLISTEGRSFEKAEVLEIVEDNLQESGLRTGNQLVTLKILSGEHKGEEVSATSASGYLYGAACTKGMTVTAVVNESNGELVASVFGYYRSTALYGLVGVFLLVIWLIGGKQGFYSVIGLIFTFICIIWLFLPMIYKGFSPCAAAVFISVLVTVVTMYLIGGASKKTVSAIIGTASGVIISGVCALAAGKLSHITGYNVSDVENLIFIEDMTEIKVGELMFAGIIIASLGAVMDVGMSVSSTIQEISDKNPELTFKELFRSGINVGRDMMGTMSNTLILAFTGGSINTLVYMYSYDYSHRQIMNMNAIAIELIQGISSSMGVVLTVPLVSLFAAWIIKKDRLFKSS
ncbi:MAG: YibE/F family protein [Ruminococcus sp.]|nr:YibE/F family protein [Ruminococcus sp.]